MDERPVRVMGVFMLCLGLGALAGCVTPVEESEDATPFPALSCAPPCGTIIDSGRRWEPSVAVDPTDPLHLVASSQDLSHVPGALLGIHWPLSHVSFDGGASWETVRIPGGSGESPTHPLYRYDAMDDSVVTFLPDGTVLWSAIARTRAPPDSIPGQVPASVVVLRSHDGGLTFPDAVVVAEGSGWSSDFGDVQAEYHDKQWMTVTADGRPLLVWSWNHQGSTECGLDVPMDECTDLVFSVSSDGGLSWSDPQLVANGLLSGAFPVVLSGGDWVVSYHDDPAARFHVAVSEDEGVSWSAVSVDHSTKFPVLTVGSGPSGERVYAAYPAGAQRDGPQDVTLRWSDDGGRAWSEPLVLDPSVHEGRTIPAIAPAGDGGVVVLYWHVLGKGAELRAVHVRDGVPGAPLTVAVMGGSTARTGDYMGLAALPDGDVYAVWNAYDGADTFRVTGARLSVA